MLHRFGLIFFLPKYKHIVFSINQTKRMGYYLFMFHGWLNIDKIESWDEQGKNGENTQFAYGWAIDSHYISECFFTLHFLRICPRANGSSSSNSTQAKFSTRIEMTMMIMRWTACTSIITHITQRVSIIFVFFSHSNLWHEHSFFSNFGILLIFSGSNLNCIRCLIWKKVPTHFPGVIFVMFYIRIIGVPPPLSQNNFFLHFH